VWTGARAVGRRATPAGAATRSSLIAHRRRQAARSRPGGEYGRSYRMTTTIEDMILQIDALGAPIRLEYVRGKLKSYVERAPHI